MTEMRLLTSDGCSLCEHAKGVLRELADEGVLVWREVDAESDEGRALVVVAPPLRPVLFRPDGRVSAYGRLSSRRLRRECRRDRVP